MTTETGIGVLPAPAPNVENQRYFDAASQGQLLIGKCAECNGYHFYPRKICPLCFSLSVDWVAATGRGSIYTYSVTRRGAPQPYAVAYVRLDEGVMLLTNIVNCDLDSIRIGQTVSLLFIPCDNGGRLPVFAPA